MGEVISLLDKIRGSNNAVKYERGIYPIFEGKVLGVSAELIFPQERFSVVDFLPAGVELPKNINLFLKEGMQDYQNQMRKIRQRVAVPFSVNPAMVVGTNVRGSIKELEGFRMYSFEILKDETMSEISRAIASGLGHKFGSEYEGFQYLVSLED